MKLEDFGPLRLAAQHITDSHFSKPELAVKHMLAMQAQDYNGALWSIGLRTKDCTINDVEQAVAARKIVRTWPMRGTLHFMHADDVHWMVELLAPRATAAAAGRRIKQLQLSDAIVEKAERILRTALRGGTSIRRDEVVKLLQANIKDIEITNQHTQHLMRNFGEGGVICFGPHHAKQPTFVLLDEWVPKPPTRDRATALQELAQRYFVSHGPASLKDFSGWGMLTVADAKAGLAAALPELASFEYENTTYYHAKNLQPSAKTPTLLLPGFDEYILGYKDRSAVLPPQYAERVVPGNNGMFLPTVVDNGQVVGTWKRQLRASGIKLELSSFSSKSYDTALAEASYTAFINK